MLDLAEDFVSNNATILIKTMRGLINNRRELERLIVQARENLRGIYGSVEADAIPLVRLEIEIIRIATEVTYSKKIVEEADMMIGDRFRNIIYKIESEYNAKKLAYRRSQEIFKKINEEKNN